MNIYISYFYKVRFMRPFEVPLSTAVWDPKWFHMFHGQDYTFTDKNGVINGMRASMFAPGESCSNLCRGRENCKLNDPNSCPFLQRYRQQLNCLDFADFMGNMEKFSNELQRVMNLDRPVDFVLLVHEAPDNPCSERGPLQAWFHDNGYELKEWDLQ